MIVDQVEIPSCRLCVARESNLDLAARCEHLSIAEDIGIPIFVIRGGDIDTFEASRGLVDELEVEIRGDCAYDTQEEQESERTFHEFGLAPLFLLLVRGGVLINGVPILVLHRRGLEHPVAFGLFARRFVIARLSIKLGLIVIGIEGHWIWPITNVHDRIGCQKFIEFTARDKKRSGDSQEKRAEGHQSRLTDVFLWSTANGSILNGCPEG